MIESEHSDEVTEQHRKYEKLKSVHEGYEGRRLCGRNRLGTMSFEIFVPVLLRAHDLFEDRIMSGFPTVLVAIFMSLVRCQRES